MKILCLIDILGPGGAQRQMVGLAGFLKEEGYDVMVATYHQNSFYLDTLCRMQVPFVYLQRGEKAVARAIIVNKFIREQRPNVVISFLETPSILACMARMFNHSFRLIVSERNTSQQNTVKEKIRFKLFEFADFVVPNSFSQERFILSHYPRLTTKVVTIPNFVDIDYFVPSIHEKKTVPEIVVAASIWPPKNTVGFIKAISILKQKRVRFHVSWYGKSVSNSEYFDECMRLIADYGISEYVELKEKTQDIRSKYQEADFFCLPSFYEGTPNVICEAMSCGLPIACSDVCDNGVYVHEDENGFLFDPYSVENIATALEKMVTMPIDKYRVYCSRSREVAEKKLSKERFVNQYVGLLN